MKNPEIEEAAPAVKRRGQPSFKPTARHRKDVMLFKAAGLSEPAIAAAVGISQNTLRKYFAVELETGRDVQRAKNLKRMVKAADKGSVTAQKALHAIFDQGDKSDLLQDPDFGADRQLAAEEKVLKRVTKKDLVHTEAVNAGANSEWADDLPAPSGTRAN